MNVYVRAVCPNLNLFGSTLIHTTWLQIAALIFTHNKIKRGINQTVCAIYFSRNLILKIVKVHWPLFKLTALCGFAYTHSKPTKYMMIRTSPQAVPLYHDICTKLLKTLDTIGNCQRPVFSLVYISTYMHKITNLGKFELNCSSKLRHNDERKNTLVTRSCVLSDAKLWGLEIKFVEKLLLSRKLRYFRGSRFSQCFILYQQLSITRYQVRFYANKYFE